MNDIIKIENLKRVFKSGDAEIVAVNDLTFSVPEGQFMAITGKSGSGKSTLLYQLGLLDHPTSGNITIAGIPVEQNSDLIFWVMFFKITQCYHL